MKECLAHYDRQLELIAKESANVFSIPSSDLKLKTRKREIVEARHAALYFANYYFYSKVSLEYMSQFIANQEHCSVIHAKKTVKNMVETDRDYRVKFEELKERLEEKIIKHLPSKSYPKRAQIIFTSYEPDETVTNSLTYDEHTKDLVIRRNGVIKEHIKHNALELFKQQINLIK